MTGPYDDETSSPATTRRAIQDQRRKGRHGRKDQPPGPGQAGPPTPVAAPPPVCLVGPGGAGRRPRRRRLVLPLPLRADQEDHAEHLVALSTAPGQPFNVLLVGSDSRGLRHKTTACRPVRDTHNHRSATHRRHDGRPDRPRHQIGLVVLDPPRPVGGHPRGGHRVRARTASTPPSTQVPTCYPDDRDRPGHPGEPLHGGDIPGVPDHGDSGRRRRHGLPGPGEGRLLRPRRDPDRLPGGDRQDGPGPGPVPTPLLRGHRDMDL